MKKISILLCVATALAAISCNKEVQDVQEPQTSQAPEVELVPMTFTATTTETRTVLDEDHVSIKWLSTDKISVWDGHDNREFTSNGEGTKVKFNGEAADAQDYLALYPYDAKATFMGTSAHTTLTADQEPVKGSFANGLNINAATSADKTTFYFENVMSVAKFTLDATKLDGKTIKSVKFASTYPLAGDVNVRIGNDGISASAGDATVTEVTMTSASGLADGTYYFVVLPNAGGEITMTFETTDGFIARKTATLGKPFTAGYIKNLGTVQGLVWTKVFFYESFDQCEGTGGNDGKWKDISATYSLDPDNSGWTFNNGNGADKCARLGSSKNKGTATTPSVALPGTVTLSFRAGAWDGGSESLILELSAIGATIDESVVTMQKAAFTDYDLTLSEVTTSTSISFAGKNNSNSRFFLDEVLIYVGDKALAYELAGIEVEPETVSAPTFDPNGGEFNTAQNVTITSTTEGATIYYTTDGTDPTTSTTTSVTNGGTVTISSSCTLKAIAAKDGVSSAVSSAVFTINSGSTYSSPVSFTYTDFAGQGTSGSGSEISVEKSPISVSSDKGYCGSGENHVRVYQNGTLTISASGNKKITKIVFKCQSSYGANRLSSPDYPNSYSASTTTGTWTLTTGATNVQFEASQQVRFTSIEVTYK